MSGPISYVVGGLDWAGTSSALAKVWSAEAPPVVKLLLIRYADCPGTVEEVAQFAGITPVEATEITERLIGAGLIGEAYEPPPKGPSLAALRDIVFARDDYRCRHCGTEEQLSLDHIYPKSLGGGDDLDNLQTLCRSCNSRKGVKVG